MVFWAMLMKIGWRGVNVSIGAKRVGGHTGLERRETTYLKKRRQGYLYPWLGSSVDAKAHWERGVRSDRSAREQWSCEANAPEAHKFGRSPFGFSESKRDMKEREVSLDFGRRLHRRLVRRRARRSAPRALAARPRKGGDLARRIELPRRRQNAPRRRSEEGVQGQGRDGSAGQVTVRQAFAKVELVRSSDRARGFVR